MHCEREKERNPKRWTQAEREARRALEKAAKRISKSSEPKPGSLTVHTNQSEGENTGEGNPRCPQCSRSFRPRRWWQRYCSPKCRLRAFLARRSAKGGSNGED